MNVQIICGPSWALGQIAKYDGEHIIFFDHMGNPHWYHASHFAWKSVEGEAMKKNYVVYLYAQDGPSFINNRHMAVRITRQGDRRVSRSYIATGASRRRMLRVLEAM